MQAYTHPNLHHQKKTQKRYRLAAVNRVESFKSQLLFQQQFYALTSHLLPAKEGVWRKEGAPISYVKFCWGSSTGVQIFPKV